MLQKLLWAVTAHPRRWLTKLTTIAATPSLAVTLEAAISRVGLLSLFGLLIEAKIPSKQDTTWNMELHRFLGYRYAQRRSMSPPLDCLNHTSHVSTGPSMVNCAPLATGIPSSALRAASENAT